MAAGKFITFEGGEGVGKSTLIAALAQLLRAESRDVLVTREPGAGSFGASVRAILLDAGDVPPASELFLFLADRANHVQNIIRPAVAAGQIVLCDRHADSTYVYQAAGRGLDSAFVKSANLFATGGLVPDATYLLDAPPELALTRLQQKDRMDREPIAFHQKVREGFLTLAREETARFTVIDATKTPAEVLDLVWQGLKKRL